MPVATGSDGYDQHQMLNPPIEGEGGAATKGGYWLRSRLYRLGPCKAPTFAVSVALPTMMGAMSATAANFMGTYLLFSSRGNFYTVVRMDEPKIRTASYVHNRCLRIHRVCYYGISVNKPL